MNGSKLQQKLSSGGFAVTAEVGPPRGANAEVVREKAKLLQGCVDAVNVTDNQTAIVRMSSIAAGAHENPAFAKRSATSILCSRRR